MTDVGATDWSVKTRRRGRSINKFQNLANFCKNLSFVLMGRFGAIQMTNLEPEKAGLKDLYDIGYILWPFDYD